MPSRPTRAPDRLEAGYRKLQRSVARTTELTDLNSVMPRVSRRVRDRYTDFARSFPLSAVLGVGGVLVVVAAVLLGLAGSTPDSARMTEPGVADDARPVSLQVSGGFGVEGSFTREPDPLGDPNTTTSGGSSDPLSRLLGAVDGSGSGGGSSGSGADVPGSAAPTGTRAAGGAPVGTLANPELVRLFEATNAERSSRGFEPLLLDTSLNRSAQRHAVWMADHGVLCHSNECDVAGEPDSATWNGWGENIAYSVQPSANVMQTAFMESAPHRANMLDPRHRYIGLGWATGYLAGTDRFVVFAVVQFGMERRSP